MNGQSRIERLLPGPPGYVVVRLVLEPGDRVQGWIVPVEAPPIDFNGWMDLMAAVNHLRRAARRSLARGSAPENRR